MVDAVDTPPLEQVLELAFNARVSEIHTCFPGAIDSFNRVAQEANIKPLVRLPTPIPVLPSVPVIFHAAHWELQEDDTGLVLVGQWDFYNWWLGGNESEPRDNGEHSINYACFLPGLRPRSAIQNFPSGATVFEPLGSLSDMRLGAYDATDYLLYGTGFADEMTKTAPPAPAPGFLSALATWVGQVDAAAGPLAGTAALQAAITAINVGLSGSWLSAIVKVK
jgi:hypothetical protein